MRRRSRSRTSSHGMASHVNAICAIMIRTSGGSLQHVLHSSQRYTRSKTRVKGDLLPGCFVVSSSPRIQWIRLWQEVVVLPLTSSTSSPFPSLWPWILRH